MTTANLRQEFPYYVFSAPGPFFHLIVTLGVNATLGPVWKEGKEVYESVMNGISKSKKVFSDVFPSEHSISFPRPCPALSVVVLRSLNVLTHWGAKGGSTMN